MSNGGAGGGSGNGNRAGAAGGNSNLPGRDTNAYRGGLAGTPPGGNGGPGDGIASPPPGGAGGAGGGGGADGTTATPGGGTGGVGGSPSPSSEGEGGGGGGAGGNGIGVLSQNFSNSGLVIGGRGGDGGNGQPGNTYGNGGGGGSGGAGITENGRGLTITNEAGAGIYGGNGGAGGIGSAAGAAGLGGVGISGVGFSIVNSGTIAGGLSGDSTPVQADAIDFTGGANRLTLNSGTLTGDIAVDGSATALTFNNAGITTLSNAITGTGSVTFQTDPASNQASDLQLSGLNTYTGSTTISSGTLQLGNGGTTGSLASSSIVDNGTLAFDRSNASTTSAVVSGGGSLAQIGPGTTFLTGANTYTGGTRVIGGTLDLASPATFNGTTVISAAAGTGTITFAGTSASPATLSVEMAAQPAAGGTFSNTLTNFGNNNTLDLKGLAYSNALGNGAFYDSATGLLTVTENNESENYTVANPGAPAYFAQSDGNGGTLITDNIVCFCSGTRIRVARDGIVADIAVEHLVVGDLVVTAPGARRPIRWLSHRVTDCRRYPRPHEVMPIRVAAHAFGVDRPARDLRVSPGHSLCVDVVGEVLIPAGALINGTTIIQDDVNHVTYWHVELEGGHDILLAENMPAESYLEMGNRGFFAESGVVDLDASPDAPTATHADFCRPFHAEGALVEVVRSQLAARAEQLGWRLEEQGLGDLHLVVDGVRIEPRTRGLSARFTVPASAQDVWLVSGTSVPAQVSASKDGRTLGLHISSILINDAFDAPRILAVDDPRFCVGFHAVEHEGDAIKRWTAGCARLPASLWESLEDELFLRIDLARPALPRWIAPTGTAKNETGPAALVG